jgi:hypothetical protein
MEKREGMENKRWRKRKMELNHRALRAIVTGDFIDGK